MIYLGDYLFVSREISVVRILTEIWASATRPNFAHSPKFWESRESRSKGLPSARIDRSSQFGTAWSDFDAIRLDLMTFWASDNYPETIHLTRRSQNEDSMRASRTEITTIFSCN